MLAFLTAASLGPGMGCSLYRMEKDLPEPYAAFLSDVRYLISSSERKAFLSAPDSAKDAFIEEFWRKRDPDSRTAENELRIEYYARLAQADDLFRTDTPRGRLSERGRVYILYGPPSERRTESFTRETTTAQRVEVWYYGGYTVVFRDSTGTGTFRLETIDLSPIEELNIARTGSSGRAGVGGRPGVLGRFAADSQPLLDFTVEIRDKVRTEDRIEGSIRLEIPVRLIWFKSDAGRFHTAFDVVIRVRDSQKAVVWEKNASAEPSYPESELSSRGSERYVIEIPVLIDGAESLAKLASGPGTVVVRLTNRTGTESVEKTVEWK